MIENSFPSCCGNEFSSESSDASSSLMTTEKLCWFLFYLSTLEVHLSHLLYHCFLPFSTNWNPGKCLWDRSWRWHYCVPGHSPGPTESGFTSLPWLLHRWFAIPTHEQELISTPVPYLSFLAPERSYFEKWKDYTPIIDQKPYPCGWLTKIKRANPE